jgi:NADP-dependent aldehyde dehydrogenase
MTEIPKMADTTDRELELALDAAAAAAPAWEERTPRERARALVAIADALQSQADPLVAAARTETGLPEARLHGELTRTSVQLRMFAEELIAGRFFEVVIDRADPGFALGPRPDLRRYHVPIGPVLVFAASNFPFAFSVAGTDTASALAAGCPVLLKAHPGHPHTSALTAAIVTDSLAGVGAPAGVFAVITGVQAGISALQDPRIAAAAFTGSVAGGRALFDIAAARTRPIPFYGELGSLNPAVITPGAAAERPEDIAAGFVNSFTLGSGQFCTKPGLLLVPQGSTLVERITDLARDVAPARMLTAKIAEGYRHRLQEAARVDGIEIPLQGGEEVSQDNEIPCLSPTLLRISAQQLLSHADTLLEETFGPAALIVEYNSDDEVHQILAGIEGTLSITVHTPTKLDHTERDALQRLVRLAATRAGRLVFNSWPTGVAVTPAQHHGGPYPATTAVAHTSVGTAAMRRFLRPITFQDAPPELLPDPLQETNPLHLPRVINPAGESGGWGRSVS